VPTPLHKEIRRFQAEIVLCEEAIADVEANALHLSENEVLAGMTAALEFCRKTLAELEAQLAQGGV
jgi:hypothetical protein